MTKPYLLLVDDSPDMALIVRLLGRRAGLEVAECRCIAEGWTALQERAPDLLLVDMILTGESGAELCRRVRAAPELKGIRMALFTDWVMQDAICEGLEAGADLVLAKHLITEEPEWQQRLREILRWMRGQVWVKLVALKTSPAWPSPPPNWIAVYNQALQQVLVRRFGSGLLRVLLHRAVQQTFACRQRPGDPSAWVSADGASLNERRITADPETAAALGASLAEQMWCLLGSRDSAFFAAALAPIVPGLTEAVLL
jgi:CheY-like chemotaxis protein